MTALLFLLLMAIAWSLGYRYGRDAGQRAARARAVRAAIRSGR